MRNDKIKELMPKGEEESFADLVEQFLRKQLIHETVSLFFIGDDIDYLCWLENELGTKANLEVIGQSKAALEQVMTQLNGYDPDVILFDVGLSMAHHIRTTQFIRNMCPRAKLLAIMPDDLPLHIRQAHWCGVHGWVLKERSLQEVIAKIAAIRECQHYMYSALADDA